MFYGTFSSLKTDFENIPENRSETDQNSEMLILRHTEIHQLMPYFHRIVVVLLVLDCLAYLCFVE